MVQGTSQKCLLGGLPASSIHPSRSLPRLYIPAARLGAARPLSHAPAASPGPPPTLHPPQLGTRIHLYTRTARTVRNGAARHSPPSLLSAPPQVHYNNPDGDAGVVDSSGLRLYYTPDLRQYDLGIMSLAQLQLRIPPQTPFYEAAPTWCPGACTRRFPTELTLVTSGYHMHTLGRTIVTQVGEGRGAQRGRAGARQCVVGRWVGWTAASNYNT